VAAVYGLLTSNGSLLHGGPPSGRTVMLKVLPRRRRFINT
jgi:hypothetical protein